MPGPKIEREDQAYFSIIQAEVNKIAKQFDGSSLVKIFSAYQTQDGVSEKDALDNVLRSLQTVENPMINDYLASFGGIMDCLSDLTPDNAKTDPAEYANNWNTLVDELSKLNGYDESGAYHPENTLNAKVHAIYEENGYGNMYEDPNSQLMLAIGAASNAAMLNLFNAERSYPIRKLEQHEKDVQQNSLADEKAFFLSLRDNPMLEEILSSDKNYVDFLNTSNQEIRSLRTSINMSSDELNTELLQRKTVQDQLPVLEEQARREVDNRLLPDHTRQLNAERESYRKMLLLDRDEALAQNKANEEKRQEIDKQIAEINIDRNAKLQNAGSLAYEDVLEQEHLKNFNIVRLAETARDEFAEELKDLEKVKAKMEELSRAKTFLNDPANIPSQSQLDAAEAKGDDFRTLDSLFDALREFGNVSGMTGLYTMVANKKNTDKKLDAIRSAKENLKKVQMNDPKNKSKEERLREKVIQAEKDSGFDKKDLEPYRVFRDFMDRHENIREDFEKALHDHKPYEALNAIHEQYRQKLLNGKAEYQEYFDSKFTVEQMKEIVDAKGNHYENQLDDFSNIEDQIVRLNGKIEQRDMLINYPKYDEDALEKAADYPKRSKLNEQIAAINKEADEKVSALQKKKDEIVDVSHVSLTDEEIEKEISEKTKGLEESLKLQREEETQTFYNVKKSEYLSDQRKIFWDKAKESLENAQFVQKSVSEKRREGEKLMGLAQERVDHTTAVKTQLSAIKKGHNNLFNRIHANLEQTLSQIDKGRSFLHIDSKEFTAMRKGLEDLQQFAKDNEQALRTPGSDALTEYSTKLTELGNTAARYINAKNTEFHLGKPSNMRLLRLRFAEDLQSFTQQATEEISTMNTTEKHFKELESQLLKPQQLTQGIDKKPTNLCEYMALGKEKYPLSARAGAAVNSVNVPAAENVKTASL